MIAVTSGHPPLPINFFSNRIGSLNLYSILPIFCFNMRSNISQRRLELEFLFLFLICQMNFWLSKIGDNWDLWGIWPFSLKDSIWDHDILFTDIMGLYKCVWKTIAVMLHFEPLFDQKLIWKTTGLLWSKKCSTASTSFLFYMLTGRYFRCIYIFCPKGPIIGPILKVAVELVRLSRLLS